MRYTIILFALMFLFFACTPKGTVEPLNQFDKDSNIEVFRYYFDDGQYVYVARFKDSPNVLSTTWKQHVGKQTVTRGNVVIFENDQIQVIQK
ncbi:hypothetical protein KBA63_03990 [Candidatus Woesebacteria bacterium]|nr:hypothetical protein [Candidatus Woesebacteria bacterium]